MNKQIAMMIVIALSATTAALAETQEEQQACTNDAFQFCQNAIPDRNRVFTCLAENRNLISAARRRATRLPRPKGRSFSLRTERP